MVGAAVVEVCDPDDAFGVQNELARLHPGVVDQGQIDLAPGGLVRLPRLSCQFAMLLGAGNPAVKPSPFGGQGQNIGFRLDRSPPHRRNYTSRLVERAVWYVRQVITETTIESRFNGPPNSGNGGYSCGVIAEGIDGIASVRLRVPPPLDRPMTLESDGNKATLVDGELLVGEAVAADLDVEVPHIPTIAEAEKASKGYVGFEAHAFPTCFVCGPERAVGDGLRIFAGPLNGEMYGAPWLPDASLTGPDGNIDRRHVWAALDCPSFFSNPGAPPALLGQLTADVIRVPEVGEPIVAIAWPIRTEGRKHWARSALATGDGELIGRAEALWIEPRDGIPT